MAEDQWALLRDQWTLREREWLSGASERVSALKDMFLESGAGQMKEDPDLGLKSARQMAALANLRGTSPATKVINIFQT